MNATPTRRLSTRRGSMSASDPWAKNVSDSNAETSCRLSILRVGAPSIQLKSPPPTRLSFASSFSKRPSSPRRSSQQKPSHAISPEELLQLARPNTISSLPSDPTFTPLPDDILLPFLDRPAEVTTLISSPPSARLFTLLQLTFNNDSSGKDPAKWSYSQFHDYLTKTNRDVEPDVVWIAKVRRCVLSHSETIWERVKGALGVPPELDVDDESDDEPNTSDLEDGGMKAKGHWDDWDAIMDSPILDPRSVSPTPLLIEPVLESPANSPFFSPSLANTNNNSMSLGGITEEDDSEIGQDTLTENTLEEGILPSQLHGIRISTSPVPSSPVVSPILSRPGLDFRRSSFETSSVRSSPPGFGSGRRSRPGSISSFSSMSLGSVGHFVKSPEERSSPLFPSSFASLKRNKMLVK